MIFVDTSFWVALRFGRDQWHGTVVSLWREHADRPHQSRDAGPVTSALVRGETWTFFAGALGTRTSTRRASW